MTRLLALALILPLSSCKLVQLPFRVVGGVTRGTTEAIKKPINARKQRKAEKEKEKAKEEAKKRREEANKRQTNHLPDSFLPAENNGTPDLPSIEPDLPPLPSEYQDLPPLPE